MNGEPKTDLEKILDGEIIWPTFLLCCLAAFSVVLVPMLIVSVVDWLR